MKLVAALVFAVVRQIADAENPIPDELYESFKEKEMLTDTVDILNVQGIDYSSYIGAEEDEDDEDVTFYKQLFQEEDEKMNRGFDWADFSNDNNDEEVSNASTFIDKLSSFENEQHASEWLDAILENESDESGMVSAQKSALDFTKSSTGVSTSQLTNDAAKIADDCKDKEGEEFQSCVVKDLDKVDSKVTKPKIKKVRTRKVYYYSNKWNGIPRGMTCEKEFFPPDTDPAKLQNVTAKLEKSKSLVVRGIAAMTKALMKRVMNMRCEYDCRYKYGNKSPMNINKGLGTQKYSMKYIEYHSQKNRLICFPFITNPRARCECDASCKNNSNEKGENPPLPECSTLPTTLKCDMYSCNEEKRRCYRFRVGEHCAQWYAPLCTNGTLPYSLIHEKKVYSEVLKKSITNITRGCGVPKGYYVKDMVRHYQCRDERSKCTYGIFGCRKGYWKCLSTGKFDYDIAKAIKECDDSYSECRKQKSWRSCYNALKSCRYTGVFKMP